MCSQNVYISVFLCQLVFFKKRPKTVMEKSLNIVNLNLLANNTTYSVLDEKNIEVLQSCCRDQSVTE